MTGDDYRKLRKETGLSQTKLARVLKIDKGTISRRERGTRSITNEAMLALQMVVIKTRYNMEDEF